VRVPVQRGIPAQLAVEGLRVRVDQELAGIAAVPAGRIVRAVDAEAVALSRADAREVAVPDVGIDLREVDARLGPALVEQAQLDPLRDARVQREVGAAAVEARAERIRISRPDLQVRLLQRTGNGG
jgi:hypothetical protein